MIKVSSLEFLNKNSFDVDIISAEGSVLYAEGCEITPEILLKLYFKDIYTDKSIYKEAESKAETKAIEKVDEALMATEKIEEVAVSAGVEAGLAEADLAVSLETVAEDIPVAEDSADADEKILVGATAGVSAEADKASKDEMDVSVAKSEMKVDVKSGAKVKDDSGVIDNGVVAKAKEETVRQKLPTDPLEFDEPQAQRVAELSVRFGKVISMSTKQIEGLEKAAYYHNIGRIKLTYGDLDDKDFKKKQAFEGQNTLLTEMNFDHKIAEAARYYNQKYDSSKTNLKSLDLTDTPYSHIVAITNYYDELIINGMAKSEVLSKMLQMGGNKFNIFILHKFINMVRNSDV